ncbi:MFS transporter [Streptomyces sp. S3(2020)]|uniref:MFS transporter n=1 Tax=Streptomyces sp. S3(2020) TaxID=2732044 RepID=UPI00148808A1|nr:MFS transporter [Streptomyces sp. S3(2020)]NNN37180.1 MFS transporter [Streptomyces sp. S3(2020)]
MPEPVTDSVRERRYRILVAGYALSSYGSYLNVVALNLYVYAVTDRALAVGAFMAVRLAAGIVAGLLAAPILARWSARSVMFWVNVVQATVLAVLVAAPDTLRTPVLFVVSAVGGITGTVFLVALRSSVIPEMVAEDRRTWANSLMVSGRSLAMVAGFASAGVVVSLLGYTAAFLLDMATFLVCAVAVAQLPVTRRPEKETAKAGIGAGTGTGKQRRKLPAAVVVLAGAPVLGLMVLLRGVDALGSSSHNAALPVYSTELDTDSPATFVSVFWCVWAFGNIVAQQVIQRLPRRSEQALGALGFGLGTIVMSGAFILAFAGLPWTATVLIALVAGAADGLTEVSYTQHLQALPDRLRTHAFGLSATVESFGFGAGMIAVGAALDAFSPLSVVAVAHGVAIVIAVLFVALVLRRRSTEPASAGTGAGAEARAEV